MFTKEEKKLDEKLYYEYDSKKDYCPRFVLSSYVVTSGFQKMVSIVLPSMILITFLTLKNVVSDIMKEASNIPKANVTEINAMEVHHTNGYGGEEAKNHLQVTLALALTIVFILPQLLDDCNRDKLFTQGNLYIMFFFFRCY